MPTVLGGEIPRHALSRCPSSAAPEFVSTPAPESSSVADQNTARRHGYRRLGCGSTLLRRGDHRESGHADGRDERKRQPKTLTVERCPTARIHLRSLLCEELASESDGWIPTLQHRIMSNENKKRYDISLNTRTRKIPLGLEGIFPVLRVPGAGRNGGGHSRFL